jgi:hypothetical protein
MLHVLYLFFSWPGGGTWSNMIASAEWVALASLSIWAFRDRLGKRMARYIHKHHFQAMEERLKEHITNEVNKLGDSK